MNPEKYAEMKANGATPQQVYLAAKKDGLNAIEQLVVLRKVFEISSTEAKEISIQADEAAASLNEFQGKLVDVVKADTAVEE